MEETGRLAPGETFAGRWVIERVARVGEGVVWYAARGHHRPHVLLVFDLDLRGRDDVRGMLVDELRGYASIDSRFVDSPQVIDVDAATGRLFVMTTMSTPQETLEDRVARSPLSHDDVRTLIEQLGRGLGQVHARGFVHGELSPSSIVLGQDEAGFRAMIVDLGYGPAIARARSRMNATGTMSTPLYVAPEATDANVKIDARADVWSMALVAFRALTGKHYWLEAYRPGAGYASILREILAGPIVAPSQRALELGVVDVAIPPAFDAWFLRATARDPSARFADAGEAAKGFASPASNVAATIPNASSTVVGDVDIYLPKNASSTAPIAPQTMRANDTAPIDTAPMEANAPRAAIPDAPKIAPAKGASSSRSGLIAVLGVLLVLCIGVAVWAASRGSSAPAPAPTTIDSEDEDDVPSSDASGAPSDTSAKNKWIRIEAPSTPWVLGVDRDDLPPAVTGFRPSRGFTCADRAFEIQQHEVTWGEIDPYLASKNAKLSAPSFVPQGDARASFPATTIPWWLADGYCKSIGGALPTEAQWELAARGVDRRRFPWGEARIDVANTHAFVGQGAKLVEVMNEAQDHTPAGVFDLMGNAQEWTADAFRDDFDPADEAWADGEPIFRAIRGLPLAGEPFEGALANAGAWSREAACASQHCDDANDDELEPPALDVRLAFVASPDGATSVDRAPFQAAVRALPTRQAILGCFDAAPDHDVAAMRALVKVSFARGAAPTSVCVREDDGAVVDFGPCNDGDDGFHVEARGGDVTTVEKDADPTIETSDAATTCAIDVVKKALVSPDAKWAEGKDAFTASILFVRVRATRPVYFELIGFRCARDAK